MEHINRRQFLFGRSWLSDDSGATPVEYGILAAGIGIAGYSVLQYVGQDTKILFKCVGDAIALKSSEGKCTEAGGSMAGGNDS
ncbi:MAG: Flp family type IVb pilin [Rhizobiaceae bacterium]